jgi:hypothetical protein
MSTSKSNCLIPLPLLPGEKGWNNSFIVSSSSPSPLGEGFRVRPIREGSRVRPIRKGFWEMPI